MRGTVIISGAARGIGRATTAAFVAAGWECVAIDHDAEALRQLERFAAGQAGRVRGVTRDLIAAESITLDELNVAAPASSRLALVNNLGGSWPGPTDLEAIDWERFLSVLTFNLKATVELTRACLPVMRAQRWGRIVNVSSVAGRGAFDFVGADYCAAKSAVVGLSRKLAQEFADVGILVNVVCPGIIATERIEQRWNNREAERNAAILAQIPLGSLGSPEAVARSVFHLASDENSYITGAVLDVNGGLHLG